MLERYTDIPIFISMGMENKIKVQDWIVREFGISKERIVNYEEYETVRACYQLEEHAELHPDHWRICCATFENKKSPVIPFEDGDAPRDKVAKLRETRTRLKESLARSVSDECDGCSFICEMNIPRAPQKLTNFDIRLDTVCNLKCCYCNQYDKRTILINAPDYAETVAEMKSAGLIDEFTIVNLANGELSLHPQRAEILGMIRGFYTYILSNCTIYDKAIAEHIKDGKTTINCSLDAGTRGTYEQIKGRDFFDRVKENLKMYSEAAKIDLKYIFLPGLNDDEENITEFMGVIDELMPNRVILSRHFHDLTPMSDYTLGMMARVYRRAQSRKVTAKVLEKALSPKEEKAFFAAVAGMKDT
jgi:MoaA/NifB/PqqE/SkfB family radical SAM enzyme